MSSCGDVGLPSSFGSVSVAYKHCLVLLYENDLPIVRAMWKPDDSPEKNALDVSSAAETLARSYACPNSDDSDAIGHRLSQIQHQVKKNRFYLGDDRSGHTPSHTEQP